MGTHIAKVERGEREFIIFFYETNAKEIYTWDVELWAHRQPHTHTHIVLQNVPRALVNIFHSVLLFSFLLRHGSVFWWLAIVEQKIPYKFSSSSS